MFFIHFERDDVLDVLPINRVDLDTAGVLRNLRNGLAIDAQVIRPIDTDAGANDEVISIVPLEGNFQSSSDFKQRVGRRRGGGGRDIGHELHLIIANLSRSILETAFPSHRAIDVDRRA